MFKTTKRPSAFNQNGVMHNMVTLIILEEEKSVKAAFGRDVKHNKNHLLVSSSSLTPKQYRTITTNCVDYYMTQNEKGIPVIDVTFKDNSKLTITLL